MMMLSYCWLLLAVAQLVFGWIPYVSASENFVLHRRSEPRPSRRRVSREHSLPIRTRSERNLFGGLENDEWFWNEQEPRKASKTSTYDGWECEEQALGKGKGKGSKTLSCAPSAAPSTSQQPSVSAKPSAAPSPSPSSSPSRSPSAAPSFEPTISQAPSSSPSAKPSSSPSASPSSKPSSSPSAAPSAFPSSSPSAKPSSVPSASPSSFPSGTPSAHPSATPSLSMQPSSLPSTSPSASPSLVPSVSPSGSPSLSPSVHPSSLPSQTPSEHPTATPSVQPTTSMAPTFAPTISLAPPGVPSETPSVSAVPSETVIETESIGDGGLESTCVEDPPASGIVRTQSLEFLMNAYLAEGAAPDQVAADLETRLHAGLVNEFLTCDFSSDAEFHVLGISSAPPDQVLDGEVCDTSSDPPAPANSTCVVILAGITLEIHFPGSDSRRHLQGTDASPEVLDEFQDVLQTTMANGDYNDEELLMLSFQGFTNIDSGGTETVGDIGGSDTDQGGSGGIDSLVRNDQSLERDDSGFPVGAVVIATALFLLLVLGIIVLRRGRRRHHDPFMKPLEDEGSIISERETGSSQSYPGAAIAHVVGDEESTIRDDSLYLVDTMSEGGNNHRGGDTTRDVHICTSATCPMCRQGPQSQTMFVHTDLNQRRIWEELGSKDHLRQTVSPYMSPNTVRL